MKSTPMRGVKKYLKPYIYNRWKSYARKGMLDRVPFASWVGESVSAARLIGRIVAGIGPEAD